MRILLDIFEAFCNLEFIILKYWKNIEDFKFIWLRRVQGFDNKSIIYWGSHWELKRKLRKFLLWWRVDENKGWQVIYLALSQFIYDFKFSVERYKNDL